VRLPDNLPGSTWKQFIRLLAAGLFDQPLLIVEPDDVMVALFRERSPDREAVVPVVHHAGYLADSASERISRRVGGSSPTLSRS